MIMTAIIFLLVVTKYSILYNICILFIETCFSEDKGPPMTPPTHTGNNDTFKLQ